MKTSFFNYPVETQIDWIKEAENALDLRDIILEKDVWICWVLNVLFSLNIPMVFKGGTSLSKGFDLIRRFSEDLDITLDHKKFMQDANLSVSNPSQIKKASKTLKKELIRQVSDNILPALRQAALITFPHQKIEVALDETGETIYFYYPKILSSAEDYLPDKVILEFGMRNLIEPHEKKKITPILSSFLKDNNLIDWPLAEVDILSPARTFWEKATLIHVECSREVLKHCGERLSRHWYDLSMLIDSWVGKEALKNLEIFYSVVAHKKIFYPEKCYDNCLKGQLRLAPENHHLMSYLVKDFRQMIEAGMFQGEPPKFDYIMENLKSFSLKFNKMMMK